MHAQIDDAGEKRQQEKRRGPHGARGGNPPCRRSCILSSALGCRVVANWLEPDVRRIAAHAEEGERQRHGKCQDAEHQIAGSPTVGAQANQVSAQQVEDNAADTRKCHAQTNVETNILSEPAVDERRNRQQEHGGKPNAHNGAGNVELPHRIEKRHANKRHANAEDAAGKHGAQVLRLEDSAQRRHDERRDDQHDGQIQRKSPAANTQRLTCRRKENARATQCESARAKTPHNARRNHQIRKDALLSRDLPGFLLRTLHRKSPLVSKMKPRPQP